MEVYNIGQQKSFVIFAISHWYSWHFVHADFVELLRKVNSLNNGLVSYLSLLHVMYMQVGLRKENYKFAARALTYMLLPSLYMLNCRIKLH